MRDLIPIAISMVVVFALVIAVSKRFKLSSRYDRKPRELNPWSSLDQGVDPTVDEIK